MCPRLRRVSASQAHRLWLSQVNSTIRIPELIIDNRAALKSIQRGVHSPRLLCQGTEPCPRAPGWGPMLNGARERTRRRWSLFFFDHWLMCWWMVGDSLLSSLEFNKNTNCWIQRTCSYGICTRLSHSKHGTLTVSKNSFNVLYFKWNSVLLEQMTDLQRQTVSLESTHEWALFIKYFTIKLET